MDQEKVVEKVNEKKGPFDDIDFNKPPPKNTGDYAGWCWLAMPFFILLVIAYLIHIPIEFFKFYVLGIGQK